MSSQSTMSCLTTQPTKAKRNGEIELTQKFSEQLSQLCLNNAYSDVTFIIEDQKLPAHRVILAARSEYFRAMLYGGLSESTQSEIHLKIPLKAFKILLKYIYSGNMSLAQMKTENVLDTLGLANEYGFTELEKSISGYLREALSLANVCAILDAARLYGLESLTNVCHNFMDTNATDVLNEENFKNLSQEALCGLLVRDSFFAPEVQIFIAVQKWSQNNRESADIESVVQHVRLPLMSLEQLLTVVRPSGILDPDRLLDAIEEKETAKFLPYRGALWPEQNVATQEFGSKAIQGEIRSALLDGDTQSYDMEKGYARHSINAANDLGMVVELGTISIINHIKLLLWDRDLRSYSYYIEVAVTNERSTTWDRVIDHTNYLCRSWQKLYFPARAVKFIRLVGTHNTVNKVFHAVTLEAMYLNNIPTIVDGIVYPKQNVATLEKSALVIEGVSRTRNVLLNGEVNKYDWDSGYTCHQLGSGVIVIQLGQPFLIDSLRILLWDCDDRAYSFYIETSINQKDWEIVVDKRDELLRSWQHVTFKARPVVFIQIVGTHNTANEIFHCVHFECPSQDPDYLLSKAKKSSSSSSANN